MTDDLQKMWNDLPVGPAPVGDILRAAHAQPGGSGRPRGTVFRRALVTGTALTAVVGAFALGSQVNGGDQGPGGPGTPNGPDGAPRAAISPVAFHGELRAADDCEALRSHYVTAGVKEVGAYGWSDDSPWGLTVRGYAATAEARETGTSDTGTNVQENGVDEPDVAKTDGTRLVRIVDDTLTIHDVTGATPRLLGTLHLDDLWNGEVLLSGSTVVVVGQPVGAAGQRVDAADDGAVDSEPTSSRSVAQPMQPATRTMVLSVDISDLAAPKVTHTSVYDGTLLSVRQHGNDVRMALSAGLPDLGFVSARNSAEEKRARARNQDVVRDSRIEDWLVTVSDDGQEATPAVACESMAIPENSAGLDAVTVVGFGAEDPTSREAMGVATEASTVYEAGDRLFLAAPDYLWKSAHAKQRARVHGATHLYSFALEGRSATYVGSGRVAGVVSDRWSMDWAQDTLRVAVRRDRWAGNDHAVVTLREQGGALATVGQVASIGRNEELHAVRWFDDLAVLVTFRQVDPLYAVDLSNPEAPRVLGKLKIPGFSQYLHPISQNRLIGMGQGPVEGKKWGARAALFDIKDLTAPRQLDVVGYAPGSRPGAAEDPRQFVWMPESRTGISIIEKGWRGREGWVSILKPRGTTLQNRVVPLPSKTDVAATRVLPVGDRAVLVSGTTVEFLPL